MASSTSLLLFLPATFKVDITRFFRDLLALFRIGSVDKICRTAGIHFVSRVPWIGLIKSPHSSQDVVAGLSFSVILFMIAFVPTFEHHIKVCSELEVHLELVESSK